MPSPTAKLINDLRRCQHNHPDRHRLMGVKSILGLVFSCGSTRFDTVAHATAEAEVWIHREVL
jgi:hypothetical protein